MNNIAFITDLLKRIDPNPMNPNAALGGGMPPIGGDDASRYFGLGINPSQEALPPIGGTAPVNWDAQKYTDFANKYNVTSEPPPPPDGGLPQIQSGQLLSPEGNDFGSSYAQPPAETPPPERTYTPDVGPYNPESADRQFIPQTGPENDRRWDALVAAGVTPAVPTADYRRAQERAFYGNQSPAQTALTTAGATTPELDATGKPVIGGSRTPEQQLADSVGDYTKPVYGRVDANGNVLETTSKTKKMEEWKKAGELKVITPPGKDRNKKWSIWEKLAAGALGYLGGGGFLGAIQAGSDRNFFQKLGERRKRADLLPKIAQQNKIRKEEEQIANLQDEQYNRKLTTAGTLANQASLIERRKGQNAADADRLAHDRVKWEAEPGDKQLNTVMATYRSLKNFKKNGTADEKAMYEIAKKNNVPMPDKDDTTGEKGGVDIDDKTIDTSLGLLDENAIKAQAAAAVGKTAPRPLTELNPARVRDLPAEYRGNVTPENPTGFNYDAFMTGKSKAIPDPRVKDLPIGELYITRDTPDNYAQRVAAEEARIRKSQESMQSAAATLRAALKTHRPNRPDAPVESYATVLEYFKKIMAAPKGDKRDTAINDFYTTYLPNIRIQ